MNRTRLLFISLLTFVAALSVCGQGERFRVMTWNVENLFDTCHDVGFNDNEFLPTSSHHWDTRRYRAKLGRLSRVIVAAGGSSPVDLVGLCEVENDSVLRDLTRRTRLAHLDYRYAVTHSKDSRGLDVALLYQPLRFRLLVDTAYVVPYYAAYGRPTRDLLHVCGLLTTGDTLDVFVCHMPSRRGGTAATERFRGMAMNLLQRKADSVMTTRHTGHVLIMGDFNDECTDASIAQTLHPLPASSFLYTGTATANRWCVLSADLHAHSDITGTYKYRGRWSTLDQIIVSASLLNPTAAFHTQADGCQIFAPPYLLEFDETNGGYQPHRTYLGPLYRGGYSDHLPLIADFYLQQ